MPDIDEELTPDIGEELVPDVELSEEEKYRIKIMRHAYQKLDALPLSFGLPSYSDDIDDETVAKYFSLDLSDTLRETGIQIGNLESDTYDEMIIENRVVYHALKRFRLTASAFFKFSTATDGKTVDKTNIPKVLRDILAEYEAEYSNWRGRNAGKLWNRSATLNYTNV